MKHVFEQVQTPWTRQVPLLTAAAQLDPSGPGVQMIRIGDAVASGMVDSETLGYFLVRTMDFLLRVRALLA